MSTTLVDPFSLPGMGTPSETSELEFFAGRQEDMVVKGIVLDSTAEDSGNTPVTTLRRGLPLGKIAATGQYADYDPTATNGQEICRGLLYQEVNMLDASGSAADKAGRMVVWAFDVKAAQIPSTLDTMARRHLAGRIFFDDGWVDQDASVALVVAKATSYTVVAADNNKIFSTRGAAGAVTFTLPTLARGLRFRFFNEAGQNMIVAAAAADTMVVFNDLAADSIAFSTASELIGGAIEVVANDDASKWLVFVHLGAETQTPTIAT